MEIHLIASCAGAGKTTKLIETVEEELARGVPKDKIAFVSFTQEGAYVGRARAINKFGGSPENYPYFRTLHSIAYHELGLSRASVMTPNKYRLFGEKMGMRFWGHVSQDNHTDDDSYLAYDAIRRNNPKLAPELLKDLDKDKLRFVLQCYKKFKEVNMLLDFTDFLDTIVKTNRTLPVEVAIIDEAQDLTTLQWKAVWTLFKECKRIYIAGDASQQIFGWAGSDEEYFLGLKPTVPPVVLNYTHRCPASVTRYANKVLALIKHKVIEEMESREEEGETRLVNSLDEVNLDPSSTYLFLARNNCFLDDVEVFLRKRAQVYTRSGKVSINRRTVELIKQYEEVRKGKREIVPGSELEKLLKGAVNLDEPWFDAFNLEPDLIDYYRDLFAHNVGSPDASRIRVSSIHAVKGAEADTVVLLPDLTSKSYTNLLRHPDAELRVLYTAVTRARQKLIIVAPQSNKHFPMLF